MLDLDENKRKRKENDTPVVLENRERNETNSIWLFREEFSNWQASKQTQQCRKVLWIVVSMVSLMKSCSDVMVGYIQCKSACIERLLCFCGIPNSRCLSKFTEYVPNYLLALLRMLVHFFWPTFLTIAVYISLCTQWHGSWIVTNVMFSVMVSI